MISWRRTAHRKRVIVNLKTDKAFRGILWMETGILLVLKDAELLEPGLDPRKLDGEVIVELPNVDFVQILPEG